MKGIDWKDVAIRAGKTFVEAFIACIGAELSGMDVFAMDKKVWAAAGISAMAAGLSAVWNGMIEPAIRPAIDTAK